LITGAGAFAAGFRLRERPGWIIGKLGFGVYVFITAVR
jgi:hypothetical protein